MEVYDISIQTILESHMLDSFTFDNVSYTEAVRFKDLHSVCTIADDITLETPICI